MSSINQNIKVEVKDNYDVIVCGGGIAGISAALASARHGAKTLLIEREYALGGLATLGLIAIYLPLSNGLGTQYSYGIAEELLKLCEKHGFVFYREVETGNEVYGNPLPEMNKRLKVFYDPNVYAIDAEQLLLNEGVKILYGTSVVGTENNDGRITHIITENRDGRNAFAVKNVVDATGDALVAQFAGEKTEKYELGNILASWYYSFDNTNLNLNQVGFSDDKLNQSKTKDLPKYTDYDANSVTNFVIKSHKSSLNSFLEGGKVSEKHSMATIATVPQLRMTNRISGQYTQDLDEFNKEYDDSVGMFVSWRKKVGEAYELPYRCLVGNKIKNLIMAGRCISSTDEMWDRTRVIPVCAVSGQAAGTAAAIFDTLSEVDIKNLQDILRKDGVKIHEREII